MSNIKVEWKIVCVFFPSVKDNILKCSFEKHEGMFSCMDAMYSEQNFQAIFPSVNPKKTIRPFDYDIFINFGKILFFTIALVFNSEPFVVARDFDSGHSARCGLSYQVTTRKMLEFLAGFRFIVESGTATSYLSYLTGIT